MRRVLPYTSDRCVFLVDDIVPNSVPNRYLAFMELVKTQQLVPLWMGSKEGMWIRSSDHLDVKLILEEFQRLYPSCEHYYLQPMNQPFWDQNFDYIITREPN